MGADDEKTRIEPHAARSPGASSTLSGSALMFQPLPANIGRFEIVRKLGEGGMGVVYEARDPELGRHVAIKVLRSSQRSSHHDSQGKHRMIREAKAMARLAHPNVVHVYEVDEFGDSVFLAMELVEGLGLRHWLKHRRRGWREIVAVFVQAGQGLAAAHAVGIVHRDFKPDNVLVGDDGRVRVLDFGLARPLNSGDVEEHHNPAGPSGHRITLTQANAYVGTPAYMSPEQHLRERDQINARSDQFSFCVALYEGLYGERPFAGKTATEVRMSVFRPLPPAPRGRRVPARLRRILVRGLSINADERFPDMDALLHALTADPARPWQLVAILVAVLAVAAGAAIAVTRHYYGAAPARSCDHGAADIAAVWNPERAAAASAAFARTGVSYAGETWPKVQAELGAYAEAWAGQRDDACKATHVRGEASEALLDLRNRCLDERLRELGALVQTLTTADPATVEHAVQSATGLIQPAICGDETFVTAVVRPPVDPALARAVDDARGELSTAAAFRENGRARAARELALRLKTTTDALDYPPLRAEVLLELGRNEETTADYAHAVEHLTTAFHEALAIGHDTIAADAAIVLALVLHRQTKYDDSFAWSEHARSMVRRTGERPDQHVSFLLHRSYTLSRLGRHAEAIAAADEALALARANFRPSDPRIGTMLAGVAHAHWHQGDEERALSLFQMSKDVWQTSLGADHPFIASSAINISTIHVDRHEYAAALAELGPALEVMTRAYGPNHPSVANVLGNLGSIALMQGRFAEAADQLDRNATILAARLGPDDIQTLGAQAELGAARRMSGRYDDAVEIHRRVLGTRQRLAAATGEPLPLQWFDLAETLADMRHDAEAEPAFHAALKDAERSDRTDVLVTTLARLAHLSRRRGALADADAHTRRAVDPAIKLDAIDRAPAKVERGETLLALGRSDEAVVPCKEALLDLEKAYGADNYQVVPALLCLGRIYTARTQEAAAREVLGRAATILDATDIRPADRAEARALLAAAVRPQDPARADQLLTQAAREYTEAGPAFAADAARLTAPAKKPR